jgi:hypothetical protein
MCISAHRIGADRIVNAKWQTPPQFAQLGKRVAAVGNFFLFSAVTR